MVGVWLIGISWSIIITRFFKPSFSNKNISGLAVWFFVSLVFLRIYMNLWYTNNISTLGTCMVRQFSIIKAK